MTSVLPPEGELRVARCDTLDKLIAVGDGDAALLYLYILRHGSEDGRTAARALHLSDERYERAAFTLNNLSAPAAETKNTGKERNAAPQYTAAELRRARNDGRRVFRCMRCRGERLRPRAHRGQRCAAC
ncbi:MAG: hypothetical protein ACLR4Z_19005 [Butyricicoccaceae bacterium]